MKYERNILGQIVCLAMRNAVNLDSILSFPLTTVPHSLANRDGSIIRNSKGNELVSFLVARAGIEKSGRSGHDVEVIDGFHLLSGLKDTPSKYGIFALFLLNLICKSSAHEIHIFFDKYKSPSLKDLDVKAREQIANCLPLSSIKIYGKNQERASSLAKCLLHHELRDELVKFLIQHWSTSNISEILGHKRVFVSFGESCHVFINGSELGKQVTSLNNTHTEIESKMIFHMNKMRANDIVVRTQNPKKCWYTYFTICSFGQMTRRYGWKLGMHKKIH